MTEASQSPTDHEPTTSLPRSPAAGPGTIAVGWDGSPAAGVALRWGAELAERTGADLRVIGCWTRDQFWSRTYAERSGGGLPSEDELAATAQSTLEDVTAAALGARSPRVSVRTVHSSHPATVLIEESRAADLLFLGTHGHSGRRAAVLGSVSADVVRGAACPVVVIPPAMVQQPD